MSMSAVSPTISACILARNEELCIEDALRSLRGWTDEILVIDNDSEDGTVALARRYTDRILTAPRATAVGCRRSAVSVRTAGREPTADGPANFDALRGLAIDQASGG